MNQKRIYKYNGMLLQLMFDNAKLNIVSCQIASEANNLNLHNPTKKSIYRQ